MTSRILVGHVLDRLKDLPDQSVQAVVTSPPYFGLRSYGTEPTIWGGSNDCAHDWQTDRYYVEGGGGAGSSAEAFSEPGEANAERIKQARWRQDETCTVCGAWRGHLGLEPTLDRYIEHLVMVFREVRRVLRDDAVCFLNMGDSYNNRARLRPSSHQPGLNGVVDSTWQKDAERGRTRMSLAELKEKDLMMVPERLAISLQADGWYVRSKMPWVKRNPMPESVTDRPTTAIEYVFMLTKRARYYWDHVAVRREGMGYGRSERFRGDVYTNNRSFHNSADDPNARGGGKSSHSGGRNFRNSDLFFDSLGLLLDGDGDPLALDVNPRGFKGAHFATFPTKLIEPLIQAGTSERGCCPTCGAPWKRVVEREGMVVRHGPKAGGYGSRTTDGLSGTMIMPPTVTAIGWEPGCTCDAGDPIPCTVLDPFVGSGTTLLVADRLGRDGIGVELLPDYGQMAADRVRNDAPMFTNVVLEGFQDATETDTSPVS